MKAVGASALGHLADLGPLCMRVGVGAVFAVHGWQKFDQIGVANFATFLDSLGVPAPTTVAWLQTIAEGIGGLLLIAGLMTRLVTIPLIAILIGAITMVKVDLPGVGFVVDSSAASGSSWRPRCWPASWDSSSSDLAGSRSMVRSAWRRRSRQWAAKGP